MIKAGIIGATGYAGNELARLLLGHKETEVVWYGSRSYIDKEYAGIYQNFFKLVDAKCMDDNMEALADEVDVIFTEMCIRDSHEASQRRRLYCYGPLWNRDSSGQRRRDCQQNL